MLNIQEYPIARLNESSTDKNLTQYGKKKLLVTHYTFGTNTIHPCSCDHVLLSSLCDVYYPLKQFYHNKDAVCNSKVYGWQKWTKFASFLLGTLSWLVVSQQQAITLSHNEWSLGLWLLAYSTHTNTKPSKRRPSAGANLQMKCRKRNQSMENLDLIIGFLCSAGGPVLRSKVLLENLYIQLPLPTG